MTYESSYTSPKILCLLSTQSSAQRKKFCRLRTDTWPSFPSSHLPHLQPPHTLPGPQFPLQPTSALCSPSEQLSHQDDEDKEEKGSQDEAEDPRQGEDARESIRSWSGP